MTTTIRPVSQFLQRRLVAFAFQTIDYPTASDSINEAKNYGSFSFAVGNNVHVIGHYHVGQD
jgi:hypothetical protein